MSDRDSLMAVAALRAALIEDILEMSDVEALAEAKEPGEDTNALAEALRANMREVAAMALRSKLLVAKKTASSRTAAGRRFRRPTLEAIKSRVQVMFAADPALGMAYREVRGQADEDWESLYDDLVLMGEIEPDADDA